MARKKKIENSLSVLKFTPIEIFWTDSCEVGTDKTWHSEEDVNHITSALEIRTIGYLVSYDKTTNIIRVCRSFSPEDSQQEGLFDIPLGCINDLRIIKGIKTKKEKR